MYRLLIVDDESTIRKGMLTCINWKEYGIGTIDEADNGAVALKKALLLKPHILLTDIRMPVMDGMELSHHIREKLPDCKIVIMSGYDEFAYAKSLMRMKVADYLLKPIAEDELMAVIVRLIKEIKEEEAHKSSRLATDKLLHENLPQLKCNFISQIIDGAFSDIGEVAKRAAVLDINISVHSREFRAMVIAPDSLSAASNQQDANEAELTQSEIISIVEELISKSASGFLCGNHFDNFIGLICSEPGNELDPDLLSHNIRYAAKERLGVTVFVSIGPAVRSIAGINGSYQKALSELDEKRYKGKRTFVQIALRYMEEHYNTDISLTDVAEISFVTPNYLSKIFKEEMDVSFVDYLNQLRVEKAKELLLHTNLKTYEIAEKVGYKDYKYFSIMLKKFTGFSPREYRRHT